MPIDAIYIENNASSHFQPIADTVRIYKSLFALAKGTFIAFAAAELILLLESIFLSPVDALILVPVAGATSLGIRVLLDKYICFRKIRGYDYLTTVGYTIICYFVYGIMCSLLHYMFPMVPLFWNFQIVYLVGMPLRFFLHQLIFIASLTKEQ